MVGFPVVVSLEPPSPQNQRQVVIEPETFELRLKLVAVLTVAEVGEPEQEFTVGGPAGQLPPDSEVSLELVQPESLG